MKLAFTPHTAVRSALALLVAWAGAVGAQTAPTPDPCPALAAPAAAASASAPGAYLCAAGVGASQLEASVAFYKGLGMVERARLVRHNRREVVLDSAEGRGSRLVLFAFTDGSTPHYAQNPGKIVFYVKDADAFAAAITAAGGRVTLPPTAFGGSGVMVGFARDRDNNLIEFTNPPGNSPLAAQSHSYIAAFAVGVSNLEAAKAFYVNTLGMQVKQFLQVEKPSYTGGTTPWYDEYILASPTGRGAAIVLMHFTDGTPKNYANNPVKLTLRVDDPAAYAQRITAAGASVQRAPAAHPELGGAVLGYASDADGTLLEILNSPR